MLCVAVVRAAVVNWVGRVARAESPTVNHAALDSAAAAILPQAGRRGARVRPPRVRLMGRFEFSDILRSAESMERCLVSLNE